MSKKLSALEVIKEVSPKKIKTKTEQYLPNPLKNTCIQKMIKNSRPKTQVNNIHESKQQNSKRDKSSSQQKTVYQANSWINSKYEGSPQKRANMKKDREKQQRYNEIRIEEELMRENENLKRKIQQFVFENIEIRDENQQLREQLDKIIRQFRNCVENNGSEDRGRYWQCKSTMKKMRSSDNIFENDRKYSRIMSEMPVNNNTFHQPQHTAQQNKKTLYHYIHWCECLENQIKLLYTIKQNLEKNLKHSQTKNQLLQNQNKNLAEVNISLKESLAEREYQNMQLSEKLQEFSETVERAHEEIVKIKEVNKNLESEHEIVHKKFHVEIERMREKSQRYKLKAEQYRCERDQFALQIQKAKAEVGGLTIRQPFTGTRVIPTKNH